MTFPNSIAAHLLDRRLAKTLGRIGQTEDIVGPVIFLASDMSRFIAGITLPVDRGVLAT